MVYYKLILNDKREKTDQIYPVVVRVTFNRISTTLSTGIRIHQKDWDAIKCNVRKSHTNAQLINQQLLDFYNKVQKISIKLQDEQNFSFDNLKANLTDQTKPSTRNKIPSFAEFSFNIITDLYAINKTGNAQVYETACNRLLNFASNKTLNFKNIDYTLLERFVAQLINDGVKTNTISNYLRTIRAIYNRAIKAKLIDRSLYPFHDIAIKSERTVKRAVSINDLAKIQTLPYRHQSNAWHSQNYFFLSFALMGISFTDLAYLKPSNIIKGRLTYRRRKTHKLYDIKLTPLAKSIISLYSGQHSKYLLPILPFKMVEDSLEAKKAIKQFIKTTNKYLKRMATEIGINEITTYVARHTWATTAKRLGYSNELIAEALGHEYGNKITNIYLDSFDQSLIDEMNGKILECLKS